MPLADEDDEWEVEEIMDSRVKKGKKFYLVRWKGWPEEYTSWQPEEDCVNAQERVQEYEDKRKNKARRVKAPEQRY